MNYGFIFKIRRDMASNIYENSLRDDRMKIAASTTDGAYSIADLTSHMC